jgi:uncharacterized protein YjbI with pentapeptide repeats
MGQITVRRTSANLPVFDEDTELEPVSSLGGSVSGFQFGEASLRTLNWENVRLFSGRIRALRAGQASVTGVRIDSVEFTGCDLSGALFDDCDLRLTSFGPGNYRGCDLRGNNLSALIGTGHLKHVVMDRVQLMQLAEALAAELDVTFGDDEGLAIL